MSFWQFIITGVLIAILIAAAYSIWTSEGLALRIAKFFHIPGMTTQLGDTTTPRSWFVGILISVALGLTVQFVLGILIELWLPKDLYAGMWLANRLVSFGIGMFVGLPFFLRGQFEIKPGQRGFLKILGRPLSTHFGVGIGWAPPGLSELTTEVSAAKQLRLEARDNLTKDGVPIKWKGSFTLEVVDPLKVQLIQGVSKEDFATAEFLDAGRTTILSKEVGIKASFKQTMDANQARKFLAQVALFKGDMHSNGAKDIMKMMNKELRKKGLKAVFIQIEDIQLPEPVEKAAVRIFEEVMQSAGLAKDADNKTRAVGLLLQTFKQAGVDLKKLRPAVRADYVDRMIDRVFANEDKATLTRINFGGSPPGNVMMNLGKAGA